MHASPTDDLDAVTDALLVASRALVGVAARSLPDSQDVTLPQFRALVVLSTHETVTATDLSSALGIHQSSATRLCDRLVRKKLVKRAPGTADRREVAVSLTAGGRRLLHRIWGRRRRELREIAARMSADARQQAIDGLLAFSRAAGEPAEGIDLFAWSQA